MKTAAAPAGCVGCDVEARRAPERDLEGRLAGPRRARQVNGGPLKDCQTAVPIGQSPCGGL